MFCLQIPSLESVSTLNATSCSSHAPQIRLHLTLWKETWLVQPKFERLWPSPSPIPLPTADVALSKLLTDEQTKNSLAKKKIVDTDHMVFACAQLIYLEFWQLNSLGTNNVCVKRRVRLICNSGKIWTVL